MEYVSYERARPSQVRAMLGRVPVAYVPLGALEWHGEHAPLGLDGLKAHYLCCRAAERTGGVVFPPLLWGAFDALPFPFTFHFERSLLKQLVRGTLYQLEGWGLKVIIFLTGHYPSSLIRLLRRECETFNRRMQRRGSSALALGVPEMVFALESGYYGDHAGMWETSIMMAAAPELIDLAALPRGRKAVERMVELGILGQDPKEKADPEKGRQAVELISANLAALVLELLEKPDSARLRKVYENYDQALSFFSPRIWQVMREALDVHSLRELVSYGLWAWRLSRGREAAAEGRPPFPRKKS